MKYLLNICAFLFLVFQSGCKDEPEPKLLSLLSARVGTTYLSATSIVDNVPTNQPIVLSFSTSVVPETINASVTVQLDEQDVPVTFSFSDQDRTVTMQPVDDLLEGRQYMLVISNQLRGSAGETFAGITFSFSTALGELKVLEWTIGGQPPAAGHIDDVPLNIDLSI